MVKFKTALVQANVNVQNTDLLSITLPFINRMKVEGKSDNTVTSYTRAVDKLVRFHGMVHPKDMDTDEVFDFLVHCKEEKQIN